MEKVEEYIKEHTRNDSNIVIGYYPDGIQQYYPWIPLRHARRIAKIAREETIKEVCKWIKYNTKNGGCLFDGWENDLKKYLEGKK